MTRQSDPDHDQRLKVLLKEFFHQFLECFFPVWAQRFDFRALEWLDKEVFLSPPQGEKRQLDLIAKLQLRTDAPPIRQGINDLVALVHIEVESRDSARAAKPRFFEYYSQLRRDSGLPVLPIVVYLRVGLEGVGWDAYEEFFWEHRILRFEYAYVGLPGLEAQDYVLGENVLGVALSTLMQVPEPRKVELYAQALQRLAQVKDNDFRRFLLTECLEAYADLNEEQNQQMRDLLNSEPYRQLRPLMITTYERGQRDGKIAGSRESLLLLLEAKFGTLSEEVKQRVEALSADELRQTLLDLLQAQSLKDLRLLNAP